MQRLLDSVRFRLTVVVTVLFALTTTGAAFVLVRQLQSTLVDELKTRDDMAARAFAQMIVERGRQSMLLESELVESDVPQGYDWQALQETLNDSVVYVQRSVAATSTTTEPNIFDQMREAVRSQATPLFGKVIPKGIEPNQYVVSQVDISSSEGNFVLSVASPLESIRRTVKHVSTSLYVGVPFMVTLVALLSWFLTGRSLRPVGAITRQVQAITASTLDQRVPEPAVSDEIGELAQTMNQMLSRLESSADRQRRFVSDASHELRSPVASIRLQMETALMAPEVTHWPQVARTVLAEDERLGSLVDNLLAIARLDEDVRPPYVDVDLDELILDHTSRVFPVKIDRSGVLAGRVSGVVSELTSLVRNLVDNAARHARTQVRVTLVTVNGRVILTVDDDGPGIPVELRSKVFDRFSRLNEARSRDAGGAGLGLALVRRIAQAHGGTVEIGDADLGGARFVVTLPEAQ